MVTRITDYPVDPSTGVIIVTVPDNNKVETKTEEIIIKPKRVP